MNAYEVKKMDKEYIGNTYKRYDVVFEKGAGSYLYDKDGKFKTVGCAQSGCNYHTCSVK